MSRTRPEARMEYQGEEKRADTDLSFHWEVASHISHKREERANKIFCFLLPAEEERGKTSR